MSQPAYPVNLNVRLTLDQHKRLHELAEANECSISEAARMVLETGFAEVSQDATVMKLARANRAGRLVIE